ncbi:MAG: hypothetical protein H7Z14_13350 [Anaerolineae bacterium]|nr:hypothetical protein [Phycisphaerae bacterium]
MHDAICERLELRALLAAVAPPVIDLLVVYTPQSASLHDGDAKLVALVQDSVDAMNRALQNSEISLSVRLVHAEPIAYSPTNNLFQDRINLQTNGDSILDSAHALRNQYGADAVALITHGNNIGGGNASLLENLALMNNAQLAFTAIAENSLGAGNYTLAHEIGHIIGAGHERGNPDGARGPFTYSYGYRFTAAGILQHDLMSYDPGLEVPYYANPAVSYHGAPTGSPIGSPTEADLASTFAVTGPYVANYRASVVNDTTAPIAQKFELNRSSAQLTFTVRYVDDSAIDLSTIDSNDIMVSGPGGWSLPATLVSIAHPNTGGAIKLATYSLLLPATNPATKDLVFTMNANAVRDFANHSVATGAIGPSLSHGTGDTFSRAQDLGTLAIGSTRTVFGQFADLAIDHIYRFTLASTTTLAATLTGLTDGANFYLARDVNNDGLYQGGTEKVPAFDAFEPGADDEAIGGVLSAGTYFAWVYEPNFPAPTVTHTAFTLSLRTYANDTTPPGATLDATDVRTAGAPSADFTVTYTDDQDLDGVATRYAAGLDVHAVLTNGANFHFNYYPDFNANGGSSNQDGGPSKTLIYRIFAFNSGTGWSATDNGTYTLSILPPQGSDPPVRDTTHNAIPLLTLGSFKIAIGSSDTAAPNVRIAPGTVGPVAGQSLWQFSVVYHDNLAIEGTTVDGNDIRVSGPGGFNQAASLVSLSAAPSIGSNRVATYQVAAPGGFWDGTDDGSYSIVMQANQVRDAANNFIPAGSIGSSFVTSMPNLVAQSAGTVAFIGTAGTDVMRFDVDSTFVYFNLNDASLWYVAKSFVAHAAISGGATGSDTIEIRRGTLAGTIAGTGSSLNVNAGAAFTLEASPHLTALNVTGTASLSAGGNKVLVTKLLSIAAGATLDLFDNDLILDYAAATQLAVIQSLINAARANGTWTGSGLTSSTARTSNPKNRTLGAIEASSFKSIYGVNAPFAGESIDTTAVLVKFTYYGDADFNGVVDFDDYSRIDAGFNNNRTGWMNGDVDGNGIVDFDDYSLIDQAFNTQGAPLRRQSAPQQKPSRGKHV